MADLLARSDPAADATIAPAPHRLGIRVTVRGDIDIATAPRLAVRLRHALNLPVSRVRVDLAGVDFMDSQGLNVLCAARAAAQDRHVAFVLDSPPRSVQRLLAVTGTADLFEVHDA